LTKLLFFYQATGNIIANTPAVEILSIVIILILNKVRPENKRKRVLSGLRGKIPAEPQDVNN